MQDNPVRLKFSRNFINDLQQLDLSSLLAIALVLVFLLGVLDYLTGRDISFSIFYLIPISLAAWYGGKWPAILTSVVSATVWLLVDLRNPQQEFRFFVHSWNAVVRLGFFLIVTFALVGLKDAHVRLKDSFARISQFSGNLAHEMRTPINNLAGEAEVALSRGRTIEEYREVLESSLEELERMSRMIDSMLFLARAEDPNTTIERKEFDVQEGVQAVQDFFDAMAEERNVEVAVHGDARVQGDPTLFRRALSNLFANSLQHTTDGGKISIFIKQVNQSTEVIVSDSGCGIPEGHLPRIFDRFYRVPDSNSNHSGAGLGLAIVKSIMDLHKGEVQIESKPLTGTTVTLRFPA